MRKWKGFCPLYPAHLTRAGARTSGRGWANTTRVGTKARMNLLRGHTGIRQLTNLHPLGVSAASLGQLLTWLGNPLLNSLPMQRHPHPYYDIHLMFIHTLPLRLSKGRMLCTNSAHVSPAPWRSARTVNFFQTTNYGRSVRVTASRPLHHLYAVPTQDLPGLEAFRSCS